jgi:hypothetical protein
MQAFDKQRFVSSIALGVMSVDTGGEFQVVDCAA